MCYKEFSEFDAFALLVTPTQYPYNKSPVIIAG